MHKCPYNGERICDATCGKWSNIQMGCTDHLIVRVLENIWDQLGELTNAVNAITGRPHDVNPLNEK